jgi:site-specific recombinase XerC
MPRTTPIRWTKVARNIFRGPASVRVRWKSHGRACFQSFPLETDLGVLRAFRDDQERSATPGVTTAVAAGSFAQDVEEWLRTREGRSCYASDRSHVKPWVAAFGTRSRYAITDGDAAKTVALWERDGVKPREVRHRLQVLRSVFKLADPRAPTPADYVKVGKVEREDPKLVSAGLIATVAAQLLEQEQKGRLRDGKTRARFLVEATCGQRPVQIMRAQPGDVQLPAIADPQVFGWWQVRRAKGGKPVRLALNPEMVQAWRLFIAADAWGVYDRRSYGKALRTSGFPADIPPYNLRHSTLQEATNAGGDFGQVSAVAGHMSPETTRRFYVRHSPTAGVTALLSGRFTGASADPFAASPTHWTKADRKAARQAGQQKP